MKSLLNRLLVFVIIASVMISVFACVAYAAPENADGSQAPGEAAEVGTTEEEADYEMPEAQAFDSTVSSTADYTAYKNKYSDKAMPQEEIVLSCAV